MQALRKSNHINREFSDNEIKEIQKFLRHMLVGVKLEQYIKIFNYIDYYSNPIYAYRSFTVKELLSFKRLKQILNEGQFEPVNLFYSVNTYKSYENSSDSNIGQITNILIDIDYKKSYFNKLTKDEFIKMMEYEYFGTIIPCPSAIIYTGNNFHITYKIKYPVNATDKAKALAKRIQKEISNKLSDFNADKSVNLTTSTRFLYTYNSKTMNMVTAKVYEDKLYELRDLQQWMPELPNWYDKWKNQKKKNKGKKKVHNVFNLYNLLQTRLGDLEKIQELRDYSCHGYRELICFLYRNFAIQSLLIGDSPEDAAKQAERMMLEFNSRFKRLLIEKNAESKTRNVERKQYNFKNETIITMLNIKDHEQRELKTIIDDNEYMRRQRAYDEKRKEERKKARRNVKWYLCQGHIKKITKLQEDDFYIE
ncbi:hypothetical protein [Tepidibacter aestuarii]|uniref:hypothetical protein n=1 Tax=Tepidibacter aestuarii TaxID=2925782 RepID=UPI0020BF6869|nr:hypothetical protein [Tepidibacter aestuarii]